MQLLCKAKEKVKVASRPPVFHCQPSKAFKKFLSTVVARFVVAATAVKSAFSFLFINSRPGAAFVSSCPRRLSKKFNAVLV